MASNPRVDAYKASKKPTPKPTPKPSFKAPTMAEWKQSPASREMNYKQYHDLLKAQFDAAQKRKKK